METPFEVGDISSIGDIMKSIMAPLAALAAPIAELTGVLRLNVFAINQLVQQIGKSNRNSGRGGKEGFGQNLAADLIGFAIVQTFWKKIQSIFEVFKNFATKSLPSSMHANFQQAQNYANNFKNQASQYIQGKFVDPFTKSHPTISKAAQTMGSGFGKMTAYLGIAETILAIVGGFASLIAVTFELVAMFKIMEMASKQYIKAAIGNQVGIYVSGAGLNQGSSLHNIAGGFGMSDIDFAHKARDFGDLLTRGGIPAGIAATQGIRPYGGLGGDQNYFNKLITALTDLTDPRKHSAREAGTMARYEGLEDFMWLRQADKQHREMVFNSMGMNLSPQGQTEAANAQAEMFHMQKELSDAWLDFGRQVLPIVITGLRALTEVAVFFINNLSAIFGGVIGATIGFFMGGLPGMLAGGLAGTALGIGAGSIRMHDSHGKGSGVDGVNNLNGALDNNATQTARLANAMETSNTMMQNGSYGGGSVFQSGNVIPKGWGNMLMRQAATGTSIALGALTL